MTRPSSTRARPPVRRNPLPWPATARAAAIVLVVALGAAGGSHAAEEDLATFDAAWKLVPRHFHDPALSGVDWEQVRALYRPRVAEATTPADVRASLLGMLRELRASHTTILDFDVYRGIFCELENVRAPTFGVLLEESLPRRLFVRALYEDGPGRAAGLAVGDRVLAVDGDDPFESRIVVDAGCDPALAGPRRYLLRVEGPVRLTVRGGPDANEPRRVELAPRVMNAIDAARASVRVERIGGRDVGIVHLWFCSRGAAELLREAVLGPLASCDALVLDLRGRGGYADEAFAILDVFRGRSRRFGLGRDAPLWNKPTVALIDGATRSAKEILARRLATGRHALLVGERTEGAVLGAAFFLLPDGNILELGATAVPVDGENLEGEGVAPDVDVDFVVPYANDRDPILQRGLLEAARLAREVVRRGPI